MVTMGRPEMEWANCQHGMRFGEGAQRGKGGAARLIQGGVYRTCFLLETRKTQRSEMTPRAAAASARAATAMLRVLLSPSSLATRAWRDSRRLVG